MTGAATRPVRILNVFPRHFDVNGDSGNALALARRLEWAGFEFERLEVDPGDAWPGEAPDAVLIGGGTVAAQREALPVLLAERDRVRDWLAAGVPVVAVGGGFALVADTVTLPEEETPRAGLGLFRGTARASAHRAGPVLMASERGGVFAGFVNLRQTVEPAAGVRPLATLLSPAPDALWPASEGVDEGALLGSHSHGPLLARNPALADDVIRRALARTGRAEEYATGERHARVDALAAESLARLREQLGR